MLSLPRLVLAIRVRPPREKDLISSQAERIQAIGDDRIAGARRNEPLQFVSRSPSVTAAKFAHQISRPSNLMEDNRTNSCCYVASQ